jgi:hypothetical protein
MVMPSLTYQPKHQHVTQKAKVHTHSSRNQKQIATGYVIAIMQYCQDACEPVHEQPDTQYLLNACRHLLQKSGRLMVHDRDTGGADEHRAAGS